MVLPIKKIFNKPYLEIESTIFKSINEVFCFKYSLLYFSSGKNTKLSFSLTRN